MELFAEYLNVNVSFYEHLMIIMIGGRYPIFVKILICVGLQPTQFIEVDYTQSRKTY